MLRPTFMSFETAKKALSTSQLGLDTVGHNIANVNTPGYTRQRNDQVSFAISRSRDRFVVHGNGYTFPGQGSEVTGISQIRDLQLDKRYRTEAASSGEYNTISNNLLEINNIFDEITTIGNHAKMSEFLAALDNLINNADTKEYANVLRNKAEQIAQVLGENYRSLNNTEEQIRQEFEAVVTDVNSILEQISILNTKIKEDNFYGNPANELNDERNLLIDQLSEHLDIEVRRTPVTSSGITYEKLSIVMRGTANSEHDIPEIMLVDGADYNGFRLTTDEESGDTRVQLIDGSSGSLMLREKPDGTRSPDVTGEFYSGSFKGHLVTLNGRGVFAEDGQNAFRGIPYYRQALDDYAATFAATMNKMNELKVYDSNGEVYTIKRDLFVSNDGGAITAGNLAVSDAWKQNPMYIETAAKNNALYTEASGANAGYLFKKNVDDEGRPDPIPTKIKFTDVYSIDKDGYLRNVDGEMLNENGQVVSDAEDAVNIADLQRAITVESTVEDPVFDPQFYWHDPDGYKLTNGTKSYDLPDPPYAADSISGVDEDGYLLDNSSPPVRLSKILNLDDPAIVAALGVVKGQADREFDYTDYVNSSNELVFFKGGSTTGTTVDLNDAAYNALDPLNVSGIDKSGYLLDNDGKRISLKIPSTAASSTYVKVSDLQQFSMQLRRSDLKRNTSPNDKMYVPGEATPNELLPGKAANDNLLAIKNLLESEDQITFQNGYTGSFRQYMIAYQSDMAQDKELNDTLLDASLQVLIGLSDSRDAISSVSIDEEGVNMMTYQNYYNAAARYMTVLDEALGQIIQNMGVVGR